MLAGAEPRAGEGRWRAVSPSATYLGSHASRAGRRPPGNRPATGRAGKRSFARVVPPDDAQAAAGVEFGHRLGVRRPFVLHDGGVYGRGLAGGVRIAASRLGMEIAGTIRWRVRAGGNAGLARRVARTGADAVYLAGSATNDGPRLIADLRDGLGPGPLIVAGDGFAVPDFLVEGRERARRR